MKYELTKDDIIQIKLDELDEAGQRFSRGGKISYLVILSIIGGFIWAYFASIDATVDNQPSPVFNLILRYCFIFPFCTFLLYLFLRFLKYGMKETTINKMKKNVLSSTDNLGERSIEKKNDQIVFITPDYTYSYKCHYITNIKERRNSYLILHNRTPLMVIPKKVCSLEKLNKLIFEQGRSS